MSTALCRALGDWRCASTPPGIVATPQELDRLNLEWFDARVPGTYALALRDAGNWSLADDRDFDADDVWFQCTFPVPDPVMAHARTRLRFEGLATLAEVWLNDQQLLSSANMFTARVVDVGDLVEAANRLVIRFAALNPVLATRHPRPSWKSGLVKHQGLRWLRTTLHGRMPSWSPPYAPVGPWRPVVLEIAEIPLVWSHLRSGLGEAGGEVELVMAMDARADVSAADLVVGASRARMAVERRGAELILTGALVVQDAKPWWPATHGDQPLYDVSVECYTGGGVTPLDLGRTGFRSVAIGTALDPCLVINDLAVFCRGVCWTPLDPIGLSPSPAQLRAALEQVRDAGMNMVRVVGTGVYESREFFDLCDELGVMVWQDMMFANLDYPADDGPFLDAVTEEATRVLQDLARHPCVTMICGGSEVAQTAAMMGRDPGRPYEVLFEETLGRLVKEYLVEVPYVANSPTGGSRPFTTDVGIAHYYGVGAYRRPLNDARRADVRFAAECLSFANVPGSETIDELDAGGISVNSPLWKRYAVRDPGASWDFDDVRDHYVADLFCVDPSVLRATDTARYLDLGRAAVAEVMARTLAEWRRPASICNGALILGFADMCPGAGPGIVDYRGRPKSAYFAVTRVLRPVALLVFDEGLNGLDICVVNDSPDDLSATLTVEAFDHDTSTARGEVDVRVRARSHWGINAEEVVGGFRDLTYAYRFGPPRVTSVAVRLSGSGLLLRSVFVPDRAQLGRTEIGLEASAWSIAADTYEIEISTRSMARSIFVDCPGARLSDDAFDLEPGGTARVRAITTRPFRGAVRAINGLHPVSVVLRGRDRVSS